MKLYTNILCTLEEDGRSSIHFPRPGESIQEFPAIELGFCDAS